MLKISFILRMFILIFGERPFMLFIGWEGLGVTSFLLVGFFRSFYCLNASLKTIFINRIGDAFFLLSLCILRLIGASYLGGLILLLAIFRKRAQFPFSAWLPAAMAAPTPISALVHSSTLVTAGVWLAIKLQCDFFLVLVLFGGGTILLGGLCALLEKDDKKVVAFSTLSQLGLIVFICGMRFYDVVFFHLILHAFFKRLLFMVVGFGIYVRLHNQNKFYLALPLSYFLILMFVLSLFSMIGVWILRGFFSKHLIVNYVWAGVSIVFLLGVVLTCFYSFQLLYKILLKFNVSCGTELSLIFITPCLLVGGGGGMMSHEISTLPLSFSGFSLVFILGWFFWVFKLSEISINFLDLKLNVILFSRVYFPEQESALGLKFIKRFFSAKMLSIKAFLLGRGLIFLIKTL